MNISTEEARLLAIYREIKSFAQEHLISVSDLGDVHELLHHMFDLVKKEEELSAKEIKQLIHGFIAGLAASRLPTEQAYYYAPDEPGDDTHFSGGPTGGVAEGQGEDPRFVTQTGPRKDQQVESE